MDSDLAEYAAEKKWNFKRLHGDQLLLLSPCPLCDKPAHLYFNAVTTQWHCKRCGDSGNLLSLKRALGDLSAPVYSPAQIFKTKGLVKGFLFKGLACNSHFNEKGNLGGTASGPAPGAPGSGPPVADVSHMHSELMTSPAAEGARKYLRERGIAEDTIRHFRLGIATRGGQVHLAVPHIQGGVAVGIKFRSLPPSPKAFSRLKGCPSPLYHADCLAGLLTVPPAERIVILCEGETDCMAAWQMGYDWTVSSTAGASATISPDWIESLAPATKILIAYDSDEAGDTGADRAARALGRWRCYRVRLPAHDVGELLTAENGAEIFSAALSEATPYADHLVKPAAEFIDGLRARLERREAKGRPTGWPTLDAIMGGLRDGELTVVTGDTGSGKSTWVTALARWQAAQGVPTLIAPFEQPAHEILGKIVGMQAEKSIWDLRGDELDSAISQAISLPVFFVDHLGSLQLSRLKEAIYLAVHRFGVRLAVLDHLHFFLELSADNERQIIDSAVREVSTWAMDLDLHIVLVVHPTKLGKDKLGNTRKVALDDLKGSSEIKKTAHNVLRVFRDRIKGYGARNDAVEISVLKCRSSAGTEGALRLDFDRAGERYLDSTLRGSPPGPRPDAEGEESSDRCFTWDQWAKWNDPH